MFDEEPQSTFRQHLPSGCLMIFILVVGVMAGLAVWSLMWAPKTRAAAEDRDLRGQLQTELRSLVGAGTLAPAEAIGTAAPSALPGQSAGGSRWRWRMFVLLAGALITVWATINYYVASTLEIDDSASPASAVDVPRPPPVTTISDWMKVAVRSSRDGIISLDSSGRIMTANPAAERLLGCETGRLAGQKASDYLPEIGPGPEGLRRFSQVASTTVVTANKIDGTSELLRLAVQRVSDKSDAQYVASIFRPDPVVAAVAPPLAASPPPTVETAVLAPTPSPISSPAINEDALHDLENQVVMLGGYSELVVAALNSQHPAMSDAEAVSRAAARAGLLCHEVTPITQAYPRLLDLNEFVVAMAGPLARVLDEGCEVKGFRGHGAAEVWADSDLLERSVCSLAWRTQDLAGGLKRVSISVANGRLELRMTPAGAVSAATPAVFDALQAVDWIEAQSGTIEMEERSETGVRFRIWLPPAAQARQPRVHPQGKSGTKSHAAD